MASELPTQAAPSEPGDTSVRLIADRPLPAPPTREPTQPAGLSSMEPGAVRVLQGVAVALGVVILAPILLSSQDLYAWAASPRGLNLPHLWPLLVPVALDLAAAACIGMTIVAAWRKDRPGIFGVLVWVFAATSAYAQYNHGIAERDAGRAQDAWWAMPAFALLGPLLLEVTLHRLRKWLKQDAKEILTGAAGFGVRWLVAPFSTLSAWATSRREGIATAPAALAFIRDRRMLRGLNPVEALHYAFGATGTTDGHAARVWLAARSVRVTQTAINAAIAADAPRPATAINDAPMVIMSDGVVGEPEEPAPRPARPRTEGEKRQPSAAERVAKAAARTPNATDAAIAARLGLSESTVRRYRRPADVSVTADLDRAEPTPAADTDATSTVPDLDHARV